MNVEGSMLSYLTDTSHCAELFIRHAHLVVTRLCHRRAQHSEGVTIKITIYNVYSRYRTIAKMPHTRIHVYGFITKHRMLTARADMSIHRIRECIL